MNIKNWIMGCVITVIVLIINTITLHDSTLRTSEYIVSANENVINIECFEFEEDLKTYTNEDLEVLSRVINGEAGSDYITDEHQLAVGSVVLNRVASPRFSGNTIKAIVFSPRQYACTWDGNYYKEPSERAIKNARYLLENGITVPENVIWQSQRRQGDGLWKEIQGHYFCY